MSRIHTPSDHAFATAPDMDKTTTGDGTGVNCLGYSNALITITASTSGGCTVACVLEESVDNNTFTTVGTIGTIPASQSKYALTASVNLKKRAQYLRVTYTIAGAVTDGANAVFHLFNPVQLPVVQTNGTVYL